jgi:hypothetical protein
MRIREAQKHNDLDPDADLDPEHWDIYIILFFKDKSHKEVAKQWKSRFSLLFLIDDGRIWIRSWICTCD